MNSNLTKYQLLVREYSRQKDFIQERLKQRKQVFENIFEELKPIGGEHPESYEKRKKKAIQEINNFINLIKFEQRMIKEVQKKFKKIDKELKKEDSLGKYFIGHGEIKSILTGVLLAPHNFSKYYDLIYSPLITELEKFNKKLKAGVYRADVTASRLLKEIFVSCLPRKEKKSWYGGVKKPGRETLEREINRFKEDVEKLIEFDYSKLEKENRLSLWSKIIGIYLTGTGVAYGIEKYYGKEETTSLVVIIIMYSALGGLLYYKWDQTGERILKWLEPDNWKLNE